MSKNVDFFGLSECGNPRSSPVHFWFEVEQFSTEGILAFLNLLLDQEWQKKSQDVKIQMTVLEIFFKMAPSIDIYIFRWIKFFTLSNYIQHTTDYHIYRNTI